MKKTVKNPSQNLEHPEGWPPNYFLQPKSLMIYYRGRIKGRAVKFSTLVRAKAGPKKELIIPRDAKTYVEEKLLQLTGADPAHAKRRRQGLVNPTVAEIWEDCIAERAPLKGSSTLVKYGVSWRRGGLEAFWGNLYASDMTEHNVRKFENWYLKHHGNRVFFNTAKHLRMLFRYAQRKGFIREVQHVNDLDLVIRAKSKKKPPGRVYEASEIEGILQHAKPRTALGVLLGRYMGLRKMEVLSLPWDQIDMHGWTMRVWSQKNKKWRVIPVPDTVRPALRERRKKFPKSHFVFHSVQKPDTHLTSQNFDKDWTRAKRLAGIKDWNVKNAARFHDLRHTCATQTAEDGWPVMVACEFLDMSVRVYQRIYVHIGKKNMRTLIQQSFGGAE